MRVFPVHLLMAKSLHQQLMPDLRLGKKIWDTFQVILVGKDLIWNSLKEWTCPWVPVHINPNFLAYDYSRNQSRSYWNRNSKNSRLNVQSILSMLDERHIYLEFSNENMINGPFKHVKVIHPLLGSNMT